MTASTIQKAQIVILGGESGGITGVILFKILEYFDQIQLFDRYPGGLIPMLIVDGHQSWLDPWFVTYINNKTHK